MKKIFFPFLWMHLLLYVTALAQKVGVNKTNPIATFDVGGSINLDSNITIKGVAGQPGQVLTAVANNAMEWQNPASQMSEGFQFISTYTAAGTGSFTVPSGVRRVMIEAWGAGGGGTWQMGGGSGAYICAFFNVSEGLTINFNIGNGGIGATNTTTAASSNNGGATTISVLSTTLSAGGGQGVSYTTFGNYAEIPGINGGGGGTYSQTAGPAYRRWYGINGNQGKIKEQIFYKSYREIFGGGGDAPMWPEPTGATPTIALTGDFIEELVLPGKAAKIPGGGGGSKGHGFLGSSFGSIGGSDGAGGMVRIWF